MLKNLVVIVTGGAGGIGSAVARRLDTLGARVTVAGRDAARLDAVVAPLQHATAFADCDLRDAAQVAALIASVIDRGGRIDAVVNCVGIGRAAGAGLVSADAVASLDESCWEEVLDVNLRGLFHLCRAAAPPMIAQRSGQIVDLSSARGARHGQAFGAPYCASKRAGLAMLQSMAAEVRPWGVRVVSILPDAVATELIAGTGLAPRGAMRAESLAHYVGEVLATPPDATFEAPVLAPQPVLSDRSAPLQQAS